MILILSGPSGVGKDTVIDAWQAVNPLVKRVVTVTTRGPRAGERDGTDYFFVSPSEFNHMVQNGQLLEHKLVHGSMYGTPLDQVRQLEAEGKIVVLRIDVQGAAEIKKLRPDAVTVFLMAPNLEVLRHRLQERRSETEDTIEMRMKTAVQEIEASKDYDHHMVNDTVSRVVEQLEALVTRVTA
jgi:guanylate kinase